MGPGRAQPEAEKCLTSSRPTTCKGLVLCGSGIDSRLGLWRSNSLSWKLAIGTWMVTSLTGKQLEFMIEVEW